jgi:hypothetical protein
MTSLARRWTSRVMNDNRRRCNAIGLSSVWLLASDWTTAVSTVHLVVSGPCEARVEPALGDKCTASESE